MGSTYIICQKCKTENLNSDYCHQCGEMINIALKRQLAEEKRLEKIEQERREKGPSKFIVILEKLRKHPNILVRIIVNIFYSIGVVIVAIAAGIAALFSSLAG